MRKKIYDIVNSDESIGNLSKLYDMVMLAAIVASIIPLLFKQPKPIFVVIDTVTVSLFILDYILRLITADFKYEQQSAKSFLRYPFSPMAIIDLLTILPSLIPLNNGFKVLRLLRIVRTLKVFRIFRILRYSKSVKRLICVFEECKQSLLTVLELAIAYIFISALIIFNFEPETFNTFFDAIYWATVSLTTVGYGDIYPISVAERIIAMVSSFIGIAIIALPAGIITGGYVKAIGEEFEEEI